MTRGPDNRSTAQRTTKYNALDTMVFNRARDLFGVEPVVWDMRPIQQHELSNKDNRPMSDYELRSINEDGTVNKTDITAEQALDLAAGKAIAFTPRNERITVEDDGTIVYRNDARPQFKSPHERTDRLAGHA
jgi:hypothetical protein